MKKSDLPWILPILTAWSQGKTIQVCRRLIDGDDGEREWRDWEHTHSPKFDSKGGAADYRIKPELKDPLDVYISTTWPGYDKTEWSLSLNEQIRRGINAVIAAYKAGELKLPEELK